MLLWPLAIISKDKLNRTFIGWCLYLREHAAGGQIWQTEVGRFIRWIWLLRWVLGLDPKADTNKGWKELNKVYLNQERWIPAGTAGRAGQVGTGGTAGCAGQVPAERQAEQEGRCRRSGRESREGRCRRNGGESRSGRCRRNGRLSWSGRCRAERQGEQGR